MKLWVLRASTTVVAMTVTTLGPSTWALDASLAKSQEKKLEQILSKSKFPVSIFGLYVAGG